jgi:hypothetical protein
MQGIQETSSPQRHKHTQLDDGHGRMGGSGVLMGRKRGKERGQAKSG